MKTLINALKCNLKSPLLLIATDLYSVMQKLPVKVIEHVEAIEFNSFADEIYLVQRLPNIDYHVNTPLGLITIHFKVNRKIGHVNIAKVTLDFNTDLPSELSELVDMETGAIANQGHLIKLLEYCDAMPVQDVTAEQVENILTELGAL